MTHPLLAQFVAEAADLLADVDDGLLRLEQDPTDVDLINSVFRAAHTFKGSSGLFDLPDLTRLTHAAEDLLDAVRAGRLELDGDLVDHLLAAFDAVRSWMPAIEANGTVPGGAGELGRVLSERLRAPLGPRLEQPVSVDSEPEPAGGPLPRWVADLPREPLEQLRSWLETTGAGVRAVDYRPDDSCFYRGEDPLQLLRQIPALEQLVIRVPEGLDLDDGYDEFVCRTRFVALSRASRREIAHVFRYVPDEVSVVDVTAAGLARLLNGEEPDADDANLNGIPTDLDPVLAQLFRAQQQVLATGDPTRATLGSVAGTVLRLAFVLDDEEGTGPRGARAAAITAVEQSLRVGAGPLRELVEDLLRAVGPTAPLPRPRESPDGPAAAVPETGAVPEGATPAPDPEAPTGRADDPGSGSRILKIEQSKVDRLLDLVGELTVAKNALPFVAVAAEDDGHRALGRRIRDEYAVVSRVSDELQQAVMDVRMLPVSTAFARVPRLVRDLGRKLGKQVRLVQEGEDTAADKDVIEMLAEPLVHLVRNSLDHGIETPAERRAAGKPPEATLLLRAVPDGDAVVVAVVDDGRGVDTQAVRRKAYERGLIDEATLESMSDADAAELIFAAGFSTAAQISDVSGRGVGMDAVRTSIERLGGTVSVSSRPGEGMTVALRLPLTMAVSRVLLITAGGRRFGVPLDDVVETVRLPSSRVTRVAGREVVVLRQEVVPLARLTTLLGLVDPAPATEVSVLVVRTPTGPLGMVVDQFHQNTDVILKPFEGLLTATPGYCGTALLGDGLVLLVLDVKELNSRAASTG